MRAFSRRELLGAMAIPVGRVFGQGLGAHGGMASRGVTPAPRGRFSGRPFPCRLTDVARQAGLIRPVICGHPRHADYIVEAMSCGAAFFDYDGDGWLDILVLTGSRFGDPPKDASNRLYKNNRDGTFTDVTQSAGLFRTGYFYGVTIGDYNNDGHDDVFLTGWPQNILYRNNGDGTFTDVTREAGLWNVAPRFGSGCCFVDSDRDGRLDLFVANYVTFDEKTVPRAGQSTACNSEGLFCGPRGLPYGRHSLYHNNGDGTFTDVTADTGIGKVDGGYGLTAVAADFDNDGWPDIYVACDSTPSLLFRNNHDGTFTEQGLERGVALSDDGMEQAGMGVAVADFRGGGCLDLLKTHYSSDTPGLYFNDGKGGFRDVTLPAGLGVETRYISWGVGAPDLDNDGNPDIFWVSGGIYPELVDVYRTPRVIFRNLGGGRFEELPGIGGPGVEAPHSSRGCAFGDFDNDGDVDILIVNQNEPPSLLRNDVSGGNRFLKVKLTGVKSNRSAIGARVTVRAGERVQAQEVMSQSSYLSASDFRLHFGVGTAGMVNVEIRWPLGDVERLADVETGRLIQVTEGKGITRAVKMGRGT
jgi:predicted nucleotidyltransferase